MVERRDTAHNAENNPTELQEENMTTLGRILRKWSFPRSVTNSTMPNVLTYRPINEILKLTVDFSNFKDIPIISNCYNYLFRLKVAFLLTQINQNCPHSLSFLEDSPFGGTRVLYVIQIHPQAIIINGALR